MRVVEHRVTRCHPIGTANRKYMTVFLLLLLSFILCLLSVFILYGIEPISGIDQPVPLHQIDPSDERDALRADLIATIMM